MEGGILSPGANRSTKSPKEEPERVPLWPLIMRNREHYPFVNLLGQGYGGLFSNTKMCLTPELEAGNELGGRRGRTASANSVRPLGDPKEPLGRLALHFFPCRAECALVFKKRPTYPFRSPEIEHNPRGINR
jgi:hypothetical protein